jgi:hypothetical protein
MKKLIGNFLLVIALVLPVALFLMLYAHGLIATVVAVAAGWASSVAWAYSAEGSNLEVPADPNQSYVSIAKRFGWACPTVIVLLTWVVWRFLLGHST